MTDHITRPLSADEAKAEAERIIAAALQPEAFAPTSYRDETPLPAYGTTPPVPQADSRIVPAWAAGLAVASVGVGAGITGVGCGAWLVLQGLASVTLYGVLAVTLPFAALAMLATAIGGAVHNARKAVTTNVYEAPSRSSHRSTTPATSVGCSPTPTTTSTDPPGHPASYPTPADGRASDAGQAVRPRDQS